MLPEKKSFSFKPSQWLRVLSLAVIIIGLSQCQKPPDTNNKKVIMTPAGELTETTQYVGDKVIFRIYYENTESQIVDLQIIDTLHPNFKDPVAYHGGVLEEVVLSPTKSIWIVKWIIPNVAAGGMGFVEVSGKVANAGTSSPIVNHAHIYLFKTGEIIPEITPEKPKTPTAIKPLKTFITNKVIVNVCGDPQLGWIPFTPGAQKEDKPFYALKDETTSGILVNFEFPGMFVEKLKLKNEIYHYISIPTLSNVNDTGKPALPMAGRILEIPKDISFTLEIFKSDPIEYTCYNVFPYHELTTEQEILDIPDFILDADVYAKDAFYPENITNVDAEDMGIMRGHRLIFLKVNPIQFNPIRKSIIAYRQIEVRVKYDKPGQIDPLEERFYSPAFEEMLEVAVLNYNDDRFALEGEGTGTTEEGDEKEHGCDYLIITDDDYYDPEDMNNPVNQLAHWKTRKGLEVKVENISNIGNTAASITNYMENAYNQWTCIPTYVVLIGDADQIIPDYGAIHDSHDVTVFGSIVKTRVATDLYYSTLDGNDYFPDLFLSRISVDNIGELEDVIDKTILYEQNPPNLNAYYNNTSLVRLFEDDDPSNGREDGGWILIERAEEMRDHLVGAGYTADRIYNFSANFANGPQQWEDGSNLPDHLTQQPPTIFPWDGDRNDIEAAFDNGNFLVSYRGHGGRTGWSEPDFRTWNVPSLDQNDMPSFVWGLTCQTGWFDDEVDHDSLNSPDDCYAEIMLRAERGGAVAIVASARNSWGSNNNPGTEGMCDALWPEFDNSTFGPRLVRTGQVLNYSKTYIAQNVGATASRLITFEMTHLFGDPEFPIWIQNPREIDVIHPEGIGATGKQRLVVKVTDRINGDPVSNAQVVLSRGLDIFGSEQTDPGGNAILIVNGVGGGDIDITVTSTSHRPYMGAIKVVGGGAYINVMDPSNGVDNQTINLGAKSFSGSEEVKIYFDGIEIETTHASSGEFGQSNDFTFEVPPGKPLGLYNVLARGSTSDRYAVEIFQIRDTRIVDLYTYSQWDETTWVLEPNGQKVWDSPEIWIQDGGSTVASNNLVLGHNYKINARIYNSQNNQADDVKVSFKWALHGVGQVVWEDIDSKSIDVGPFGSEVAQVEWAPSVSGHVCLKAELYHIEDINPNNNRGQENCHVGPTASPAEVKFTVCNPTERPGMIFFEVFQHRQFDQEGRLTPLWGSFIKHPDPQLLKPGECTEAMIIVDPDYAKEKVMKGDKARFTVNAYIERQMIGGIDLEIEKK